MFLKIVKCEKRVGKRALRPRESTYSQLSNEPKKIDIGSLLVILCDIYDYDHEFSILRLKYSKFGVSLLSQPEHGKFMIEILNVT